MKYCKRFLSILLLLALVCTMGILPPTQASADGYGTIYEGEVKTVGFGYYFVPEESGAYLLEVFSTDDCHASIGYRSAYVITPIIESKTGGHITKEYYLRKGTQYIVSSYPRDEEGTMSIRKVDATHEIKMGQTIRPTVTEDAIIYMFQPTETGCYALMTPDDSNLRHSVLDRTIPQKSINNEYTSVSDGIRYSYYQLETGIPYALYLSSRSGTVTPEISIGEPVAPGSIDIYKTDYEYYWQQGVEQQESLHFTYEPAGTYSPITLTSSDETVVAYAGKNDRSSTAHYLNVVGPGKAVVTATTDSGLSLELDVTVKECRKLEVDIPLAVTCEPADLEKCSLEVPVSGYYDFLVDPLSDGWRFYIRTQENRNVDTEIIYGSDDVKHTYAWLDAGVTYDVTVRNNQDTQASGNVLVSKAAEPTEVAFGRKDFSLKEGRTSYIPVRFIPEDAYARMTFTTSDAGVVSIADTYPEGLEITAEKPGTAVITVTTHNGLTAAITVTVEGETPTLDLVTQPNTQVLKAGTTAAFTAEAKGDALTYQWQVKTSESGSWKDSTAASAVTGTLKVSASASRNGYYYRCRITDSAGNVVYTDTVRLYVLSVSTQPVTQKVKSGTTAAFTVKATGDGLSYQWQIRTSSAGSWKNSTASSASARTLKVSAATSRNGYYYRCKITDSAGNTVYTDTVRLYVLGVTSQPTTQKVKAGKTASFAVSATGSGRTYQWQVKTSSGGSWKDATSSSASTRTLKVSAATSRNGYYYRCRITDSAGNVVYTDTVRLYVLGITAQPASRTVKSGSTATFTVSATGSGRTYQWQTRTGSGKNWKNTTFSGCTTAKLSVKATAARNGYQYRCKITDSAGNVVYSSAATLKVK